MSEAKFIEGPWHVDNEVQGIFNGKCHYVCDLSCDQNTNNLIAAAPEMYEMLKACSEILKQCDLHNTSRDIDKLLAKARGES